MLNITSLWHKNEDNRMINRINGLVLALVLTCGLAACMGYKDFSEVEALNAATPSGSPFTRKLAEEYRTFSNFQLNQDKDYVDAIHFARKGLFAANGGIVMPEPVDDWDLTHTQYQELTAAHTRLIAMFHLGAMDQMPEVAAIAQSRFDCWIEAEEEVAKSDTPYVIPCKSQFFDALAQLENNLKRVVPEPEPMPMPEPEMVYPEPIEPVTNYSNEPVAIADAVYLVFFDFDKSNISAGAQDVVNTIAQEIQSRQLNSVVVVGHADSSGSKSYNMALGNRRANAVKSALIQLGVPAQMIRTSSQGENELLVQTADGVKEPANRRATITFE